jgi:WD40 repeat protein
MNNALANRKMTNLVKEVFMSRFTFRTIVVFTLFTLLLTSCSVLGLTPQSVAPAGETAVPVTPTEPAAPAAPTEPEAAAHGEPGDTTAPTPTAEAQVITPETAILLKEAAQVQIENPYRLFWSQDGKEIGMLAQGGLSVLDSSTLATLSTVVVQEPITVLDFSPTTGLMATTSDQMSLDLREIKTGQIVRTIAPENGFSNAVFSTDGSQIALSSWDEIAITLWNTASGEKIKKLTGFETAAPVYGATFSSDDRYLIWVARGSAQVMDVSSGAMGAFLTHEDFIGDAKLSPNGHLLAVTTAGTINNEPKPIVQLWDATSGQAMGTLLSGNSVSQSLAFSPDGNLLVVAEFNELAIWDVNTQTRLLSLPGHTDIVTSVAFSPDGRTLVSSSADGTIRLWQVR